MTDATDNRAANVLYDNVCPKCDGKVCIEDGIYWPEVEADVDAGEPACEVCGGLLDA